MSNMNKIVSGGYAIKDKNLAVGGGLTNSLMLYQSLISEALVPDTFTFNCIRASSDLFYLADIRWKYLQDSNNKYLVVHVDEFDPESASFGDEVDYYINDGDTMVGKFYVRTVRRLAKKIYRVECMSAIGLLTYRGHNGGIYDGETVGDLIAEIMSDIPYTIDSDLADVTVKGWLPKVQAARDNLLALLFMSGGSVRKAADGGVHFGFIGSGAAKPLEDVNLSVGGSIATLEPATRIEVTSHEYFALAGDETVTLYDNTSGVVAADGLVVDFREPCHDLLWNGSALPAGWDYGANYAVVSGIGTLTGKKYTHITSIYDLDTGVVAQPNVLQIENNHLINPGNVANAAKRIKGYYSIAKEVNYTMRVNGERPGDKVTFTDPFGDQQTGYIKNMNVTLSKRLNSVTTFALNWTPGPFGDSYTDYKAFRASDIVAGRLTLPAEMVGKQGMVLLISGAGGGQAGFDGEQGGAPQGLANYQNHAVGVGGAGGAAGSCGERPLVLTFFVENLPSYYDGASVGIGGAGGASNGANGSVGGATTLGGMSSADGIIPLDDVVNLIDGTVYCTLNSEGYAGGDGGAGSGKGSGENPDIYYPWGVDTSTNGGDVATPDGTWVGGTYLNGLSFRQRVSSGSRVYDTGSVGGGGAAYGADGSVGYVGDKASYDWQVVGGNGANATAPSKASETQAGRGGNGGGGGGGAAQGSVNYSWSSSYTYGGNTGGTGGLGSAGGQGGDGLIIIYYNA